MYNVQLLIPLDLISAVQACRSSATSSGSTLVRSHESSHLGCWTLPLIAGVSALFDLSFFLEKIGMSSDKRQKCSVRIRQRMYCGQLVDKSAVAIEAVLGTNMKINYKVVAVMYSRAALEQPQSWDVSRKAGNVHVPKTVSGVTRILFQLKDLVQQK